MTVTGGDPSLAGGDDFGMLTGGLLSGFCGGGALVLVWGQVGMALICARLGTVEGLLLQ